MNEREFIYILKAFAIFCVLCAHVSFMPDDAPIISIRCGELLNYLGTIGVPVFFILSGYLFEKNKKSFVEFWKGKFISIIIPWIFCETLLWIYIIVRKSGASFFKWILFMVGYNHSTYYLSVLLIFYILFWWKAEKCKFYVMIFFSLFSIMSTGWHIGIDFINSLLGTFYLNPLNWAIFFVVGIIISNRNILIKYASWSSRNIILLTIFSFSYFFIMEIKDEYIYYFSKYAIFAHIVNISLIIGIAYLITNLCKKKKAIIFVGKNSFSIYLLHQFVTGAVIRIINETNSFVLILMRPFIVLCIVLIMIYIITRIGSGRFKILKQLFGIR